MSERVNLTIMSMKYWDVYGIQFHELGHVESIGPPRSYECTYRSLNLLPVIERTISLFLVPILSSLHPQFNRELFKLAERMGF